MLYQIKINKRIQGNYIIKKTI